MGVSLETSLGPKLVLSAPVMTASGTFGYGDVAPAAVDLGALGAVVTKSITRHPREGHPPPRISETPSGLLNAIGLANIGVDEFCREKLPALARIGNLVIVSIAGSTMDEYAEVLSTIEEHNPDIGGYEINVSCPNVAEGGMEFGVDCGMTESLTRRLRDLTERFLMVKLSPNVTDIGAIARSAAEGGADALSAINTVVGMDIDPASGQPSLHTVLGGLSGPAIRPIALACVYQVARAVQIPVVGLGGITDVDDVIRFLQAGAAAVQIGTANYRDPTIAVEIIAALRDRLAGMGLAAPSDLPGVEA